MPVFECTLFDGGTHGPKEFTVPNLNDLGLGDFDLGSFNPHLRETLILKGAELLTFWDSTVRPRVFHIGKSEPEGSWHPVFGEDWVPGQFLGERGRYPVEDRIDLLSQLSNRAFGLNPWSRPDLPYDGEGGASGAQTNDDGGDYVASFTVVPEPSTMLLTLVGAASFLLRRRR